MTSRVGLRSTDDRNEAVASIRERTKALFDRAKQGTATTRAHVAIPPDRVDGETSAFEPFAADAHYFQLRVNEMFLARPRQWYSVYQPMVFAAAAYIYDGAEVTAPFVVGRSILEKFGQQEPVGMIFRNVPVTGLHPYRGGGLTLTVLLSRVEQVNNADRLLGVIEGIAGAVGPSAAIGPYLKMAEPVVQAVETLLGLSETQAVLGYHTSINPDVGDVLRPTYSVLIDEDEATIDPTTLRVKDGRLHVESDGGLQPYRAADFVLFRVTQATTRTDEETLPFNALWREAQDLAGTPDDAMWREAKARFLTLNRMLMSSPDLTESDAVSLGDRYLASLKEIRERAVDHGSLSHGEIAGGERRLRSAARELDELD